MSIRSNKPKDTLRISYIKTSRCYTIYFEVAGCTKTRALFEPIFEITGSKMKKRIESLASDLKQYGISLKDIESSILEACNDVNHKPPKYLR